MGIFKCNVENTSPDSENTENDYIEQNIGVRDLKEDEQSL
jgi:hypothetical protein